MCGHDWCSVRISKEIVEWSTARTFASQRAKGAALAGAHRPSSAAMLEKRGVLPAEELHRSRVEDEKAVGAEGQMRRAHSDVAERRTAERVQAATLIGAALVRDGHGALEGCYDAGSSASRIHR